jgi:hypothetical protein
MYAGKSKKNQRLKKRERKRMKPAIKTISKGIRSLLMIAIETSYPFIVAKDFNPAAESNSASFN